MPRATNTPTTSRRGLLAGSGVGAILAGIGVAPAAAQPVQRHPDADLIAACNDFLRLQRAFEAHYATLSGDMEENDPAWDILDPMADLEEKIVRLRAVTAEGHLARAQCVAFSYLPHHRVCQDDPEAAREDRFQAACMRDLIHMERGDEA